ncbi:hypothetical protein [Ferrovibrio xuzhouensis]|uniref:Uncharacterized protein n=1 Tax=Ferrovibrio xuzhouensis TaxID=1576914 RepID=A0ABV7VCE4_9PROT
MSTQPQIQFPVLFSDTRYVSAAELTYYRRRAFALRQQAIDSGLRKLVDNVVRTVRALSTAGQVRLAAAE